MRILFDKKIILFAGYPLAVFFLVIAGYFYVQFRASQNQLANPTAASAKEARQLVGQVGKLMILPTSEEPTVATVTDLAKLKDQPFFAQAQNGDKVLIYTQTKKAVLYRPSAHKIIDVAPINIGDTATASAETITPTSVPTRWPTRAFTPIPSNTPVQ